VASPALAQRIGIAPALARPQLRGAILHCGSCDPGLVRFDGSFGGFLRTVLWSYFGTKDFMSDPRLAHFAVVNHVSR
jgi:hypothetical protein